MASVQDRLKIKRESCDTWSTREQLCLASSVLKSGDQNWMSVSRSLKPFAEKEALRPPDWFSQKSCAVQYALLLENADTPKRKKRESGETTSESIVRRLRQERIAELGQILAFQRDEYQQLKAEVNLLKSASVTDDKLQKMWVAIEQEEREQEQKARAHSAWLAKRQQKMEVPTPQITPISTPKKMVDSGNEIQESVDSIHGSEDEKKNRSGQTALLTSLLTSQSSTIQNQNPTSTAQVTSPTIASLLGSNTKLHATQPSPRMSPQLHQLVTSAMSTSTTERPSAGAPTLSMLLALPANLSRGSLSTIQTTTIPTPVSDVITTPTRLTTNKQITANTPTARVPVDSATSVIPETESMVQIIDHIDDVIGKDKIADVIDKDEINEIIGDIEELIKEEITGNPQTTPVTPPVIAIPSTPIEKPVEIQERPHSRDTDETVTLSSSPDEKMAIDIDQSNSKIAEIIGTAIETTEPKVIVQTIPKDDPVVEDKSEEVLTIVSKEKEVEMELPMETEDIIVPENNKTVVEEIQKDVEGTQTLEKTADTEKLMTVAAAAETKVDEIIVEEKIEKQKLQHSSTEDERPEESLPSETENKNNETPLESKEEETTDITKESEDSTETEKKSPVLELIEAKSEHSEINDDEPPVITKEEETQPEQLTSPSDSGELKEEVTESKDAQEENESISQDDEKHVKSPEICDTLKEEDSEGLDETSTKEEIDSKAEDSNSMKSTPTIPPECDDMPDQKTEDIPTPKPEIENETDEMESKVEDLIVKAELLEEDSSPTEDMKVEEMEPAESVEVKEVNEVKDVKDSTEVKKTTDIKTIREVAKVESVMEVTGIPETPKEVKESMESDESEEVKENKEVIDLMEAKDTKELREIRIEKLEKSEKLDKADKGGREDASRKRKEEEILEIKKEEQTSSVIEDVETEEEESSLTKLSAGRAMKTYSKKQNVAIDSEPETENSGEGADYRAWKKAVMLVYNRLATHKYASVFLRPITEDQAPGYHSVIFRPMDLSTIKKNIDNGTIRSTMHFQRDVMLMFQNAIMYNKHDTFVYQMAVSMQEECLQHMQILVEVTGEGPFRRETRTAASSSGETSDSNALKRKRSLITPSPHDTESPRMKKRRKSEND